MKGKNFSANNLGQRNEKDLYQTHYSMVEQLLESEKFDYSLSVLEPCAGKGAIVKVLSKYFTNIIHYDIQTGTDFLLHHQEDVDYIITNPPFKLAGEFIEKAKKITRKKIAMLLPLAYLHGQKRYESGLFSHLETVHVFTRYPMLSANIRDDGKYPTGMMVYSWFVWNMEYNGSAVLKWINNNPYVINSKTANKVQKVGLF